MPMSRLIIVIGLVVGFVPNLVAQRAVSLDDLYRLRDVSDPQVSPDGGWVAYTVAVPDSIHDRTDSDIWMTSWDGSRTLRLTWTPGKEHTARWSPDGRYLAFLTARDDKHDADQVWLLDRSGGEAERITDLPGGVSDYTWAPDSKRLALIASDPDSDAIAQESDTVLAKRRPPIVIDRLQFKKDEVGYLTHRRNHLYVLDLANRKAELITPGDYDEMAPAWSPDSRSIAFVSKRRPEADRDNNWDLYLVDATTGDTPRQLTSFPGPDMDPEWESRVPSWSPDGNLVAYMQGGPDQLLYYAGQKVAVVPAAGGTARVLTASLDRNPLSPTFSSDGASVLFLLEDDRVYHLARVPAAGGPVERLVEGRRTINDFSVGPAGKIAALSSTPATPPEIYAVEGKELRQITHQNDAWLASVRLSPVEEISFKSKDGTEIHGFLVKPADYQPGVRYPTILRIHGGPVSQYFNDFDSDWQILASAGYVVVAANPRGSSGRGEKFSTAIWAAWGQKDGEDVLGAVDYAVAQGIADPARLGVGGWSYGGILTNEVIARDHRFKAATSGAGQGNAIAGYGTDQYIREYEAELGQPWKKPDVWMRVSYPFFHADRIVTPTLFLCGDEDFNVPLLNSEQMYQALRSLGRQTQLVIYPGEPHGLKRPSHVRDRLERYLAWYGKYLATTQGSAATR
jgi:dipeptidyl aminopeptidase/acylaminoacyl peptidase